jgi:tRNA dimethylallyltransferase
LKIMSMEKKPKIIAIVGPTASGKSNLAIKLAKKFNGEIVSADSRQIYRGMDIGTAKPELRANGRWQIANGVAHHLIDIKNPDESYTVADYKRDALRAIQDILRRHKLPIIVGGTGLYVKAIIQNLSIPRVKADPKLRKKLEDEMAHKGLAHLFKKLVALDPEAEYIVDPKNPRRVIRALEVILKTKKPFSAKRKSGPLLFEALQIGLFPGKEKLKQRIEKRVDAMMKAGLLKEVGDLARRYGMTQKTLRRRPVQAFDSIGYRELIPCLEGKKSVEEAVAEIKRNTWHYAKRQMTWWKKDKEIIWIKNPRQAIAKVEKFLQKNPPQEERQHNN